MSLTNAAVLSLLFMTCFERGQQSTDHLVPLVAHFYWWQRVINDFLMQIETMTQDAITFATLVVSLHTPSR
jgi:hypothetical protein